MNCNNFPITKWAYISIFLVGFIFNLSGQNLGLEVLRKQGISEGQARQLARMRGLNFETFLSSLSGGSGTSSTTATTPSIINSTSVVDAMKVKVDSSLTGYSQENSSTILTKEDVEKYFGYEIFLNNPFASKEYLVGNIDEGYIIAPGDVLRLVVFGDNSMQIEAKVDLNGNISIPNFGIFFASGSSFGTLKNRLKVYLGKYFSGILSSPQRTFLDVSLTQIRPVAITVLGEANTPGPHLVNGYASVLNALYASGGIKTSGSLRVIKVYRNNQLLKEIDLYNYITTGKLDSDIRLTNNDIIFIPPRLSYVKLNGAVKKEATYELKHEEKLSDLIKYSGGLPPTASLNNVNVQRITPVENRDVLQNLDRYLTSIDYLTLLKQKKDYALVDGDVITFSNILSKSINEVQIRGNVYKTGSYPLDKYSNLYDLIVKAAGKIRPNTYLGKVDIFKEDLEGKRRFLTYNLSDVLERKINVILENDDDVKVYNNEEVVGQKMVTISGFTTSGKSTFWRENLNLFDIIFQSTSFEELDFQSRILSSRVDVKRFNLSKGIYDIKQFKLDDLAQLKKVFLEPKDEVILYSKNITEVLDKSIKIRGLVRGQGQIKITNEMTIEDAILAAGGFLEFADQDSIVINRESFDAYSGKVSDRYTAKLDVDYLKGFKVRPDSPFHLLNNDIITIRKRIGVEKTKSIEVNGEVYYPGFITLEYLQNSIKELIEKAGGLKNTANLEASYINRDGKIISLNLSKLISKEVNILLDGDKITIASNNGIVSTLGALQNENTFIWEEGRSARYYIRNSGGRIRSEASDSYILLPNGQTKKLGFLRFHKILPNTKIIVNRAEKKSETNVGDQIWERLTRILTITTTALTTALLVTKL